MTIQEEEEENFKKYTINLIKEIAEYNERDGKEIFILD